MGEGLIRGAGKAAILGFASALGRGAQGIFSALAKPLKRLGKARVAGAVAKFGRLVPGSRKCHPRACLRCLGIRLANDYRQRGCG
ncbi:hypothetical protein D4N38_08175 [Pseudomonas protegens]|nr:hypothetical protein D4N38_08175 [Pseudomonas protegens]